MAGGARRLPKWQAVANIVPKKYFLNLFFFVDSKVLESKIPI